MSLLFLLRHAKAAWARPGLKDFDRPLDERGMEEARAIAAAWRGRYDGADQVFCSPAARARQTWTIIAAAVASDANGTQFIPALYDGDASTYFDAARNAPQGTGSLLVVGHNPMIEDFTHRLIGVGEKTALHRLRAGFPTCGMAVLSMEGDLHGLTPHGARLEDFLTPASP